MKALKLMHTGSPWHSLDDTREYIRVARFDVLSQTVVSQIAMVHLFSIRVTCKLKKRACKSSCG
jgi:hypothetical protein